MTNNCNAKAKGAWQCITNLTTIGSIGMHLTIDISANEYIENK